VAHEVLYTLKKERKKRKKAIIMTRKVVIPSITAMNAKQAIIARKEQDNDVLYDNEMKTT
jgi:hypothetical protein